MARMIRDTDCHWLDDDRLCIVLSLPAGGVATRLLGEVPERSDADRLDGGGNQ
jgi:hypothetical protein